MFPTLSILRRPARSLAVVILLLFPLKASPQSDPPGDMLMRPILGVQKMLFIRVKYPDDDRVVLTADKAAVHAENLNAIFKTNSYNKLSFDIDVTPVLMMPQPTGFYSSLPNRQAFVRLRADAIKIAEDAGFLESDYDREIIFTPKAWPQKQTGIGSVNLRTCFLSRNSATLAAHELGHSFDWPHANFWRTTGASPIDTAGEKIDYGDKFDIMGDVANFHHFNPWYKFRAGWLPPESILTVSESGTYTVRALELSPDSASGNAYSALRIRRGPNSEYWVYYRSKEDSADAGALISRIEPRNRAQTLLLDMTPGSKANKNRDHEDAALAPGRTIRDREAGIEITVLQKNDDGLRVQVVVPQTPIDRAPIIDIVAPGPDLTLQGAIDYEATAFDPDVGETNGAGIDTVSFVLGYTEGNETLLDGTYRIVAIKHVTAPPYIFHVETDSLRDEWYRLFVIAASRDGVVNKATLNHIIDNTGPSTTTVVAGQAIEAARTFQLRQNYPNPFNPSTTITYSVQQAGTVELRIYDMLGRKVRSLVQESKAAGEYSVQWDGRDDDGRRVVSGSYLYELRIGDFTSTKRMLLLK